MVKKSSTDGLFVLSSNVSFSLTSLRTKTSNTLHFGSSSNVRYEYSNDIERVLKSHNDDNIIQLSISIWSQVIGKTIIIVILLIIIVFQPLTMNTTILSSSIRNLTIIEETMNTTMGWLLNITITNLKSTSKISYNYEHYINWFNVEHNSQYNNRQYTIRLN